MLLFYEFFFISLKIFNFAVSNYVLVLEYAENFSVSLCLLWFSYLTAKSWEHVLKKFLTTITDLFSIDLFLECSEHNSSPWAEVTKEE